MKVATLDLIAAANGKLTTDELRHPTATLRKQAPVALTRQQARDYIKMLRKQEVAEKGPAE